MKISRKEIKKAKRARFRRVLRSIAAHRIAIIAFAVMVALSSCALVVLTNLKDVENIAVFLAGFLLASGVLAISLLLTILLYDHLQWMERQYQDRLRKHRNALMQESVDW